MSVIVARSFISRTRGLFGRRDFTGLLVLVPCNDVHTFGMKRSIDVAFVSHEGRVLQAYERVGPGRRLRCSDAALTVERFSRESDWLWAGDTFDLSILLSPLRKGDSS